MQISFTKYEGAGNDFILIDDRDEVFATSPQLIAALCDRHFGIGADGLMTLRRSAELDCSMRYYNADGSPGEMCGNGARCFTLFAEHLGIGGQTKHFDATDGIHTAHIRKLEGSSGQIELGMINVAKIDSGAGWWFLNTGVPHYVEFTEELDKVEVTKLGRMIRYDTARFPQGTNVNFVEIMGDGEIRMRTYERGVENETLACGTGATAAAIITNFALQHETEKYRIIVPGGELGVSFAHNPGTQIYTDIRLTGPARRVFSGVFESDNF
ncbi:diaminopimelate epimerase [uncultured Alistipes sp.]|jgi:diaminopimelate epimerase|uniref:diaminopimelate epimerase n=1 Tax=uncultured Alistipes sp. TaxID=538949 RepID=UPI0025DCF0BB|nr:diaminopimelate epimerase [uncultured Alistipes sp.]